MTQDPIGVKGGIQSYAYVLSDPIAGVDPLGLFLPNAIAAAGGAIFGAASGFWYTAMSTCDGMDLSTADWSAVAENTIVGAAGGALTGATFGAATVGGAALGATVIGSSFGMNAGIAANVIKGGR